MHNQVTDLVHIHTTTHQDYDAWLGSPRDLLILFLIYCYTSTYILQYTERNQLSPIPTNRTRIFVTINPISRLPSITKLGLDGCRVSAIDIRHGLLIKSKCCVVLFYSIGYPQTCLLFPTRGKLIGAGQSHIQNIYFRFMWCTHVRASLFVWNAEDGKIAN